VIVRGNFGLSLSIFNTLYQRHSSLIVCCADRYKNRTGNLVLQWQFFRRQFGLRPRSGHFDPTWTSLCRL